MKKLTYVFCALLVLTLMWGCAGPSDVDSATERPSSGNPAEETAYTLYFPDDEACKFRQDAAAEELIYLPEIIKTNTTEITVKNTGDIPFTCWLYYPDNPEELILTFTIDPGKKESFSNLTSRFEYGICFQSSEAGRIEAAISG